MKVALVHDYLKDFGGAERVLEALCEMYPDAPIYTAFYQKGSSVWERFKNRDIRTSWVQSIPFFATKLHSSLRFLAPLIWSSFDFSEYDVVISSASWYVTKGFGRRKIENGRWNSEDRGPVEICYCHTPPRWLYGYKTSVEWQKYWPVTVYAAIIGYFMRKYDFSKAQKVDFFIANSKETAGRIKKFYRREAKVIYPPATLSLVRRTGPPVSLKNSKSEIRNPKQIQNSNVQKNYYFMVSRIVGGKGIELAIDAAVRLKIKLKIAGSKAGFYSLDPKLLQKAQEYVEFLGFVSDEELVDLYRGAKAFLALATDEDFGITPVESMLCGTPVIAYYGGGYKETVLDARSASLRLRGSDSRSSGQGPTGVFFHEPTVESLSSAIKQFNNIAISSSDCIRQAQKFSKERFMREIKEFVEKVLPL